MKIYLQHCVAVGIWQAGLEATEAGLVVVVEVEVVLAHLAQLDVVLLVPLGHRRLVRVLVLPLVGVVTVDVFLVLVLLQVVLHHVPLLVADVGRVADCADHLHGLQDGRVHGGDWPVDLTAEPAGGQGVG